jgi:hypothetical protein
MSPMLRVPIVPGSARLLARAANPGHHQLDDSNVHGWTVKKYSLIFTQCGRLGAIYAEA